MSRTRSLKSSSLVNQFEHGARAIIIHRDIEGQDGGGGAPSRDAAITRHALHQSEALAGSGSGQRHISDLRLSLVRLLYPRHAMLLGRIHYLDASPCCVGGNTSWSLMTPFWLCVQSENEGKRFGLARRKVEAYLERYVMEDSF